MISIRKVGSAALLALLVSVPAYTQDGPPPGPGPGPGGPAMRGPGAPGPGFTGRGPRARAAFGGPGAVGLRILQAADANGDRSVERAEFDALADEEFDWRDRNADGFIDLEDQSPIVRRLAETRDADADARRPRMGGRVDENDDRRVSRAEYLAAETELFTRLDADGDQVITPDELDAQLEARRNRGRWWREP